MPHVKVYHLHHRVLHGLIAYIADYWYGKYHQPYIHQFSQTAPIAKATLTTITLINKR